MGSNNFWVDPDGVERQGPAYLRAAAEFRALSGRIDEILYAYPNAFGGDDLGEDFRGPFMNGVADIRGRINLVADRLEYTGDGLVSNGRDFRRAEDDATAMSQGLRTGIETQHEAIGDGLVRGYSVSSMASGAGDEVPGDGLVQGYVNRGRHFGEPEMVRAEVAPTRMAPGVDGEGPIAFVEPGRMEAGEVRPVEGPIPIVEPRRVGEPALPVEGLAFVEPRRMEAGEVRPPQEGTYVEFDRDATAVRYQPEE